MKKIISSVIVSLLLLTGYTVVAQNTGDKTTIDMTIDELGSVVCEFSTKYTAQTWNTFQRTIGNNTSILKNSMIRQFPKFALSEFNYSQEGDNRTNKIKFKVDGMMDINKNGKWSTDLDAKDPDITKISDREFLLLMSGTSIKLHLPSGTDDAKVEKDSFGKAMLTYSTNEGRGMGRILLYAGLLLMAVGAFLLWRNMKVKSTAVKTIRYENVPPAQVHHQPAPRPLQQGNPAASPDADRIYQPERPMRESGQNDVHE